MRILLFAARPGPGGEAVRAGLTRTVPPADLEVVGSWDAFNDALARSDGPASIVIIWDPSVDDLRRAAGIRESFPTGRILLALPDQKDETVVLAHRLLPAFITYVDEGTAELLAVVGKLTKTGSERVP
jgi:hypothetical protein